MDKRERGERGRGRGRGREGGRMRERTRERGGVGERIKDEETKVQSYDGFSFERKWVFSKQRN